MAKKMNFRNDMREAKNAKDSVEEAERLPTEKGYTRTKRKLKGTKPNEQTLRHGKKPIEKPKQSGKLKSALVSQQLHERLEQADQDNNIGVEAVNRGTQTAEAGAAVARDTVGKVRKYGEKLHDRAVKPEVSAERNRGRGKNHCFCPDCESRGNCRKGSQRSRKVQCFLTLHAEAEHQTGICGSEDWKECR